MNGFDFLEWLLLRQKELEDEDEPEAPQEQEARARGSPRTHPIVLIVD
jgi:hypothetical protein